MIALSMPYLLLTACDSAEQKAQNAKWEEQASFNAVAYIQQKYGFTAEVTGAEVDREQGMFGTTPLSDVFVEMRCENRDFTVFITGKEPSAAGADTYQAAEIEQAVFDAVNAEIPGLRQLDISACRKSARRFDTLYDIFYDGSNLAEVIRGSVNSLNCYYPETDFSEAKQFSELESLFGKECGIRTVFYSCRGEEVFAQELEPYQRVWLASHAVYCTQQRSLAQQISGRTYAAEFQTFDLQKYGDFYYHVSYDDQQTERGKPVFEQTDPVSPETFDGWGTRGAEIASKAYRLTADSPMTAEIYYPCSAIEHFDYDGYMHSQTKVALRTDTDGEVRVRADSVTVVGDYVCVEISARSGTETIFEFLWNR